METLKQEIDTRNNQIWSNLLGNPEKCKKEARQLYRKAEKLKYQKGM